MEWPRWIEAGGRAKVRAWVRGSQELTIDKQAVIWSWLDVLYAISDQSSIGVPHDFIEPMIL